MNVHTKNPLRSGDDFTGTEGTSESVLLPESLPGEASCFSEEGDAIFAAPIYLLWDTNKHVPTKDEPVTRH